MRRRNWLWLALIALILLIWKIWPSGGAGDAEAARGEDPRLVVGRVWVDSKPQALKDYVHAFVLVDGAPIGVVQKASAYDAHLSVAEYRRDGAKLELTFLQTDKRLRTGFKITRCDDLPPFDLCLTLAKSPWPGPKKFYSMRDAHAEALALGDLRARLLSAAAAAAR